MKANIWYEKCQDFEPGSGLESIFYYLWQMRQKKEFMQTQLLVEAIVIAPAQLAEGQGPDTKRFQKLNQEYFAACFPYAEREEQEEISKQQEVLKKWVEKVGAIKVDQVYEDPSVAIREHRREKRRMDMRRAREHYSNLLKKRI